MRIRYDKKGGGWRTTFRASFIQVRSWMFDHGIRKHEVDECLYFIKKRETVLGPKGTKLNYRGGGCWVLYGYSMSDRMVKYPDEYHGHTGV